jgi:hypothetical protein
MKVFCIRGFYSAIGSLAVLLGDVTCVRKADPVLDPMTTAGACDTTPMKPLGRVVEMPDATPLIDFGVVAGTVVQDETGDALEGAVVDIRALGDSTDSTRLWRSTNSKGGFTLDSLKPRQYRLRVRRVGEHPRTFTIQPAIGRVDTLTVRLRAFRCYGY